MTKAPKGAFVNESNRTSLNIHTWVETISGGITAQLSLLSIYTMTTPLYYIMTLPSISADNSLFVTAQNTKARRLASDTLWLKLSPVKN